MASIIENLITELNDEYALYEQLLQVSMEKTSAICLLYTSDAADEL